MVAVSRYWVMIRVRRPSTTQASSDLNRVPQANPGGRDPKFPAELSGHSPTDNGGKNKSRKKSR